jgi:hypothetical protein
MPKAVKKASKPAVKAKPKTKKGESYECKVCGYRVIVDETCGCAEEHVFVCCEQPMKKARRKTA